MSMGNLSPIFSSHVRGKCEGVYVHSGASNMFYDFFSNQQNLRTYLIALSFRVRIVMVMHSWFDLLAYISFNLQNKLNR